ncbi:hypothetical protein GY45DRAFT_721716 [Cubamyces sp. BRFM 1775]|nr:hypothetical protein GY45DRAFT_721716 [Cubamyces sp. BRFM 1775]
MRTYDSTENVHAAALHGIAIAPSSRPHVAGCKYQVFTGLTLWHKPFLGCEHEARRLEPAWKPILSISSAFSAAWPSHAHGRVAQSASLSRVATRQGRTDGKESGIRILRICSQKMPRGCCLGRSGATISMPMPVSSAARARMQTCSSAGYASAARLLINLPASGRPTNASVVCCLVPLGDVGDLTATPRVRHWHWHWNLAAP